MGDSIPSSHSSTYNLCEMVHWLSIFNIWQFPSSCWAGKSYSRLSTSGVSTNMSVTSIWGKKNSVHSYRTKTWEHTDLRDQHHHRHWMFLQLGSGRNTKSTTFVYYCYQTPGLGYCSCMGERIKLIIWRKEKSLWSSWGEEQQVVLILQMLRRRKQNESDKPDFSNEADLTGQFLI